MKPEIERVTKILKEVRNPHSRVLIQNSFTSITGVTFLWGEKDRMKQILLNCVECCLEKTRRGRIDITAKYIEEKRIVKFTVKDSGQGLEDGELKKLRGSGPRPIDINNIGIENLLHRVQELLK